MSPIAAYVPDLMDRSKVAAGAPEKVTFVNHPSQLAAAGATLVVVDLTRPGVLEELPELCARARVVAFANHTRRDLMAAATAAGCAEVMARSDFFPRVAELLAIRPGGDAEGGY